MSERWTKAQQAAIDDRGGALLVSAAAGSGKTAVLTERAVRLITDPENPVDADRLLIVTFTKAAAAELRARIGQALLRLSAEQPENGRLRRQQMLLQRAPVCTIDSFCLDLLRRHFEALDIPPDFTTASGADIEPLRAAALSETMEAACQEPDFCAFADLYGKGRSDSAAEKTITQIYDFLRSLPDYNKKLDEMLRPWQQAGSFVGSCWQQLLLEETARSAKAASGLLTAALAECRNDLAAARVKAEDKYKTAAAKQKAVNKVNDQFAKCFDSLEAGKTLCSQIAEYAENGQWDDLYALLEPYTQGTPWPLPSGKQPGEHGSMVTARVNEAKALLKKIMELVPCSLAQAEEDRATAQPLLGALFAAVKDFDRRFTEKKLEKKLLEFSDFEHFALRLLRGEDGQPTPLCESIRAGYGAVMVDEYQDTNALQDALYQCLAAPDGRNLFLVGDLKQSIYRFREADSGIFREKLNSWPLLPGGARPTAAQDELTQPAVIALDANFRSAPGVVDGINYLFEQLMTPTLGDVAYGDGQRLVCGVPGEYRGAVEVCFLLDEKDSDEDDKCTDAQWIAGRIAELVAAGEPVRDGNGTRPVQYEDCCILLAARKNFREYSTALEERGIPVYADTRENLFDAPHIRPLIALLRVIDNPAQDVYLASALLGPFFRLTDDDLVRLRTRQKRTSLYGVLVMAAQDGEEPFTTVYTRLGEWRRLARSVPPEDLLEEIFASTGYLAALGSMENGLRRREDARRFAAFCADAGKGGISALVRTIEAAWQAGGDVNQSVSGSTGRPGCVTIMTIHGSKGLQFPVVFVGDNGHNFNITDAYGKLLCHRSYGVGLQLRAAGGEGGLYDTAPYMALSCAHKREMSSEELRLLYVALTRAQDRLIVTVPFKEKKLKNAAVFLAAGAGETLHEQAHCFADWLCAAMLVHPCGGPLRRLAGNLQLPTVDTQSVIEVTVYEKPEKQDEAPVTAAEAAPEPDERLVRKLREGFAWEYPQAALADVPAKVSVTSIVHKAEQTVLERPGFLSREGLTAAEMGTALHAFLEHADFAALARAADENALIEGIRAERERQTQAKFTLPQIAEKLDERRLLRFFTGEAFARIRAAERIEREYAFITALPARAVMAAQGTPLRDDAEDAQVLVQGIADLVLIYPDHIELLDYKTDHNKTEQDFLNVYRPQLNMYALALNKRFAPKQVTYKGIYSFTLGRLIDAGGE